MGDRVDDRVQPVPVGLVAVERKMLDCGDNPLCLRGRHRLSGERASEQRVFRYVFEVAPVADVAGQIHSAAEQNVEAAAARLPTQHLPGLSSQLGIEAGAQRQGGGQRSGRVARSVPGIGDAQAGIRHQQRRHP